MERLERFVKAQDNSYTTALREVKSGHKKGHWIWYIFPQMKGLGRSHYSEYYGIEDLSEATAYLNDPILGSRLVEITEALLNLNAANMIDVVGYPDVLKVQSCMTLFEQVENAPSVFSEVLDLYYDGKRDEQTLKLLNIHIHEL